MTTKRSDSSAWSKLHAYIAQKRYLYARKRSLRILKKKKSYHKAANNFDSTPSEFGKLKQNNQCWVDRYALSQRPVDIILDPTDPSNLQTIYYNMNLASKTPALVVVASRSCLAI
ncbi:hypothetical protein BOTNAR_0369g00040 [Botryotinia narcissicola]|uniref:Uncharacterized protein n=1 Tax=Botryotinia narcissicola TaxID=278944 RepID=A0A4Z1I2Z1_9HELO|nr:hypothetical protein BOTNAR_0369g00040 [Botryotinia narcissicola]